MYQLPDITSTVIGTYAENTLFEFTQEKVEPFEGEGYWYYAWVSGTNTYGYIKVEETTLVRELIIVDD